MATMLQLAAELREQCLSHLKNDADALKVLRLVNQDLGTMATELLFSKVVLRQSKESAKRFMDFAISDMSHLARCIVINPSDINPNPYHYPYPKIYNEFRDALICLEGMENLEEIQLQFSKDCRSDSYLDDDEEEEEEDQIPHVPEDTDFRYSVLDTTLVNALKVKKLKSLTIKNLQDAMETEYCLYESEEFISMRSRLSELHLQITTDGASDDDGELWRPVYPAAKNACQLGFGKYLPEYWLKPMNHQLTRLSLDSSRWRWGVLPLVDFRDIPPFPLLKSLYLGKFTIVYNWQVGWILAHGSTLRELLLDECSVIPILKVDVPRLINKVPDVIPGAPGGSFARPGEPIYFKFCDLRWHGVFDQIQSVMSCLQRFTFSYSCHGDNDYGDDREFDDRYQFVTILSPDRYLLYDGDDWQEYGLLSEVERELWGMSLSWNEEDSTYLQYLKIDCDKEDRAALIALQKTVQERADLEY